MEKLKTESLKRQVCFSHRKVSGDKGYLLFCQVTQFPESHLLSEGKILFTTVH